VPYTLWAVALAAVVSCGRDGTPTEPDFAKGGGGAAPLTVTPTSLSLEIPPGTRATITATVQFVGLITAATSDVACATVSPASLPATKAPGASVYVATFSVTPVQPGSCSITVTDKKGDQRVVAVEVLDGRAAGIVVDAANGATSEIVRVRAGGVLEALTPSTLRGFQPTVSYDGSRIAFEGDDGTGSKPYVMQADGSGLHALTGFTVTSLWGGLAFSPDGQQLALSAYEFPYPSLIRSSDIYLMSAADGSGLVQLTATPDVNEFRPSFSPDGRRIAFYSELQDGQKLVSVMDSDGGNRSDLAVGIDPSFSPDGSKLVFSSSADGDFDIYVMNVDGTQVTQLTRNSDSFDTDPVYSPDGSRIAFLSDFDLHVMSADGTGEFTAAPRGALYLSPDWK
jgi:TolB protein